MEATTSEASPSDAGAGDGSPRRGTVSGNNSPGGDRSGGSGAPRTEGGRGRGCRTAECREGVDLERGVEEAKTVPPGKGKRDCRICQLSLDLEDHGSGLPIELGCACKEDLAAAHAQCAEAWFKIKGNTVCEICGAVASNVADANGAESTAERWSEASRAVAPPTAAAAGAVAASQTAGARRFWQGNRFLNFLLVCMVFAFVISWLFRFNVPS